MKDEVLLITPIWSHKSMWGKFGKGAGQYLPSNILSLAAVTERAGFDTKIYDASSFSYGEKELIGFLKKHNFKVVGITSYTAAASNAFDTIKIVKKILPNSKVIFGGIHATLLPEQSLKECGDIDVVCVGEGEKTFLEYVQHVIKGKPNSLSKIKAIAYRNGKKIIRNKPRERITDLGWLPMPAYHLVDMKQYILPSANYRKLPAYPMYVSRGCPFQCSFCNSSDIFGPGGTGYRPISKVIKEIKFLKKKNGMKDIFFYDGTFTSNKKWVKEFCRRIIKEKIKINWSCNSRCDTIDWETIKLMKKAGCWKFMVGVESANQKSLDLLNKHETTHTTRKAIRLLQKAGIQVTATYIIGLPGEDEEDVKRTINFAKELCTEVAMFYIPIPNPKTKLMEDCKKDGGLVGKIDDWGRYTTLDINNPLYINPRIGHKKMLWYYNYAYNTYFTNPRVILKNLLSIRTMTEIKRIFYGFLAIKDFVGFKSLTARKIKYSRLK